MPHSAPQSQPDASGQPLWRLLAGPAAFVLAIVLLGRVIGNQWPHWEETIASRGLAGFGAFLGIFVLLTSLCFPVSILGFSAGAIFGPWRALLLVFPGGLVSGLVMFLVARLALRNPIRNLVRSRPRLAALDALAGSRSVRLNLLTRLSPFNFGLASYTLAAGATGLRAYLVGLLATLPSMTAHVVLGHLAALRQEGGTRWVDSDLVRWLAIGLGILFLGILTWTTGRMLQACAKPGWPPVENQLPQSGDSAAGPGECQAGRDR